MRRILTILLPILLILGVLVYLAWKVASTPEDPFIYRGVGG